MDMTNKLETVRSIIEYHHTIRSEINRVNQSINDLEALFKIRGDYAALTQSSLEELAAQTEKIQGNLISLEDRLDKHFSFEEEHLPDILGEVLMKGLVVEHNAIREEIKAARDKIFSTRYDSTGRNEVILQKSQTQQVITYLAQHIEGHASREEIVLDMAREGLET